MTIATAIAALSPNLWLKLDEASGTTAANSGSLSTYGVVSGDVGWGAPGPEVGTHALRLFAGGQVLSSAAMDVHNPPCTLAMFVSTDASGSTSTPYPVLGIGDPGNRLTRGPMIFENHVTANIPKWWFRVNVSGAIQIFTTDPIRGWHHVALVWQNTSPRYSGYVDGNLATFDTFTGEVLPLLTDPLLLRSDEPLIAAHVCFWGGVLTQTQIQSIANQVAPWPLGLPINYTPPTSGGGGGLTPDQATQLSETHGWTSDIPGLVDASNFISSTVSTIQGMTGDIQTKVNQILSDTASLVANIPSNIGSILETLDAGWREVLSSITDRIPAGQLDTPHGRNISGGITCIPVYEDLSNQPVYSITVEINSYPDGWQFSTPDHAWSARDFAVIRFYVGTALVGRQGIHTIVHTITPLPNSLYPLFWGGIFRTLPANYHVTVDWADGVCGTVTGTDFLG